MFSSKLPVKLNTGAAPDKRCTSFVSATRKKCWKCIFQRTGDVNLEMVNKADNKESESFGENGCRQKCLDKGLFVSHHHQCQF